MNIPQFSFLFDNDCDCKAKEAHSETAEHKRLLDAVDDSFDSAQGALQTETQSIRDTRGLKDDFCWMYAVIAGEVAVILLLLYIGL